MGQPFLHAAAAAAAAVNVDGKEIVHREQLKHHVHSHKHVHQRQSPADTSAAITEVTQTISVIEQIDVNTSGAILSTQDVPLDSRSSLPASTNASTSIEPASLSSSSIVSSTSVSAVASSINGPTSTGSIKTMTIESQSASDLTSTPSIATTTFATITAGSNSSTTFASSFTSSGSLSSTINFSSTNSTSTRTSSSSSSSLSFSGSSSSISTSSITSSGLFSTTTFTSGSSSSTFSATSFISSTRSSSDTFSSIPSSTFDSASHSATGSIGGSSGGALGIGASGTSTSSSATSTSSSGTDSSSSDTTTPATTTTVLASVFGGIAGIGLILVVLLFLLKWHKRRTANQGLGGPPTGGEIHSAAPDNRLPSPSGGMSERTRFTMPAGLLNLVKPNRASRQTMRTVSSTAGSEQGFVRVSGRKIRSVLESGGDGYGDPSNHGEPSNLDGASFYQDSRGVYGGHGNPAPPGRRSSGVPNLRPSPARTPVIEHAAFSELNLDQPAPTRPEGDGHLRSSMDGSNAGSQVGSHVGSHVSAPRFTEDV